MSIPIIRGEEPKQGAAQQMPPLRTYIVSRYTGRQEDGTYELEQIPVMAHVCAPTEGLVMFISYVETDSSIVSVLERAFNRETVHEIRIRDLGYSTSQETVN